MTMIKAALAAEGSACEEKKGAAATKPVVRAMTIRRAAV
jgi:hypothetical protein